MKLNQFRQNSIGEKMISKYKKLWMKLNKMTLIARRKSTRKVIFNLILGGTTIHECFKLF